MESCVVKVQELRTRFPHKDIQVDGGVGPGTVGCCARAGTPSFLLLPPPSVSVETELTDRGIERGSTGSNVIVAGTALFGATDPASVMVTMKAAVEESRASWGKL